MPFFIDQLNRQVPIPERPQRIISLVPSITELLWDLGLEKETMGVTRFCTHPSHWLKQKTKIGGTKDLKLKLIRDINPDLILASKEENNKDQVEELAVHFPVWVTDVKTLEEAIGMIQSIGAICNRQNAAGNIVLRIRAGFDNLSRKLNGSAGSSIGALRTAYLIWQRPYMAAGSDSFIHDMMKHCGISNIFADQIRYPVTDTEWLNQNGCDLILLSSEPFPFREKHQLELARLMPESRIMLVDGTYFSWYGSRLAEAPMYFEQLCTRITQ